MALPFIFSILPTGNVPAANLDSNFDAVGKMGGFTCVAAGINTLILTPAANQPALAAYYDLLQVKFVIPNTTTGVVNMSIGLLASLPVYTASGAQATTGDLVAGNVITAIYSSSLNSGGGGWALVSSSYVSINRVVLQSFISNGTYTPSVGMLYCIADLWAGGGGGGGVTSVAGACAAGGGAGGYSRKLITAAAIGASQAVTIGISGAAGVNTGGLGGAGGTTSLGAIISATGGLGGQGSTSAAVSFNGGIGGVGSGGDLNTTGNPGGPSIGGATIGISGYGGATSLGGAGRALGTQSSNAGQAGVANSGSGGSGAQNGASPSANIGGAGGTGYIIITEFCH